MSCLNACRIAANSNGKYATGQDFCELFMRDVKSFYLLSFLLTADCDKAEQCFVSSLDECVNGISVFREQAESWARRVIIRSAVRITAPHSGPTTPAPGVLDLAGKGTSSETALKDPRFASVLALEGFERFVYVLTILERLRDQSCAILLSASRQDVWDARVRALQQTADFNGSYRGGSRGR